MSRGVALRFQKPRPVPVSLLLLPADPNVERSAPSLAPCQRARHSLPIMAIMDQTSETASEPQFNASLYKSGRGQGVSSRQQNADQDRG